LTYWQRENEDKLKVLAAFRQEVRERGFRC